MSERLINRPGLAEIVSGENKGRRVVILERAAPEEQSWFAPMPAWKVKPLDVLTLRVFEDFKPAGIEKTMESCVIVDPLMRPIDPNVIEQAAPEALAA